ncbi:hypothetical protein Emed_001199 [Eimeria media]
MVLGAAMLFKSIYRALFLQALLCALFCHLSSRVEAAADVGVATTDVLAVDQQGLAQEDVFNETENEPLEERESSEKELEDQLPKLEEFADLLLLERELGGKFLNEQERVRSKLHKIEYKALGSFLTILVSIFLLEIMFRVYMKPAGEEVRAAYRLKSPGSKELSTKVLPIVTILSSPAVSFLVTFLLVVISLNVYKLFSNMLSYNFAKLDYMLEEKQRQYDQQVKEEEEEKRRAAAIQQQMSSNNVAGVRTEAAENGEKAAEEGNGEQGETKEEGKAQQQEENAVNDSS